jgi:chromosome segregation ATPase
MTWAEPTGLLVPSAFFTIRFGWGFSKMCKKIVIAALAVGLGLAVVRGTWVGSHLRWKANKVFNSVKHSVPPEQEIARLRMEVHNLGRDDDRHYDKVARMMVAVDKLDGDVKDLRAKLKKEEARLAKLHTDLAGEKTFVIHGERRYTKDNLRAEALAFKTAEENLKSKEANLDAQRMHLSLEHKKLTELRTVREQMATELQKLETALAQERHAQAASESTIDDSGYRRLRKEMDSVKERIEVLKKKRELRGELNITTRNDQAAERDSKADKFLDERFGNKAKEVAGDENQ